MLRFPDPKIENELLYRHVLSEVSRLWDTSHSSQEFIYLLDWVSDYEDEHYFIDFPQPDVEGGVLFVDGESIDEPFQKTQFAVDVDGLADFSSLPEVEEFSFRVVMNGYIGESGTKYFPAKAMKMVKLLEKTLEYRMDELIEVCDGSKN